MNEQTQIGKKVETDPTFEDRWWQILKVARGTMTVLVLAGLTGIFGRGPLSKATVDSLIVPLHVEYERFPRFRTPASIEVTFSKQTPTQTQADLRLSGEMMNKLSIQQITPMPVSTQALSDGAIFTFDLPATSNTAKVVFTQQPGSVGLSSGEVALFKAPPVKLKQFIYP